MLSNAVCSSSSNGASRGGAPTPEAFPACCWVTLADSPATHYNLPQRVPSTMGGAWEVLKPNFQLPSNVDGRKGGGVHTQVDKPLQGASSTTPSAPATVARWLSFGCCARNTEENNPHPPPIPMPPGDDDGDGMAGVEGRGVGVVQDAGP